MKILITGDLVINREYDKLNLSDSIVSLFNQSDLNIINLEAPVTNSTSKILKTGPHLKSHKESTLQVLKALEVDVVTLANNHVLDYCDKGIDDTLEFCKENNIKAVGAGMNLKEASQTLYLDSEVGRIAILNFAENEWASATVDCAGAHPMDIIDNSKQINDAKGKADFVFVIVHGGHEYYNLPSPRMQKQYRFYADQGADIVIGHHPHCVSGNEVYNGVPIFYSLGNFIFTSENIQEDWYKGLILEVEIINSVLQTKLHPVKQDKKSFQLSFIEGKEEQFVLTRINNYNNIIENNVELQKAWQNYAYSQTNRYLKYLSPISFITNKYIGAAFKRLPLNFINTKGIALYLNLMRCEAHRDVSIEVTKRYLNK